MYIHNYFIQLRVPDGGCLLLSLYNFQNYHIHKPSKKVYNRKMMINCKCSTPNSVLLTAMTPFQGDLKKRTPQDIAALAASLQADGLLMPFALWQTPDGQLFILDGHGRRLALVHLAMTYPEILTQEFPAILITEENEEEARKALLQITSTYGRVSRTGVIAFAAPISGYKAPVISRATKPIKAPEPKDDRVVVKLRVPREQVKELTAILAKVDGVEIY